MSKPNKATYDALATAYGGEDSGDLTVATGWNNSFWSTTEFNTNLGYLLSASSFGAYTAYTGKTVSSGVLCYGS